MGNITCIGCVFVLGLFVSLSELHAAPVIQSSPGYSVTWDGNDGDYFNNSAPIEGNVALVGNGGVAFVEAVAEEGEGESRRVAMLNDGEYGNDSSWIARAPRLALGVSFRTAQDIVAVAWGRDNDKGPTMYVDRCMGEYKLQITQLPNPGAFTPDSAWTTIATLRYQDNEDDVVGGLFTAAYRHRYEVGLESGAPVRATGVRIVAPAEAAIDEIEAFAAITPARASGIPVPLTVDNWEEIHSDRVAPSRLLHWEGGANNLEKNGPVSLPTGDLWQWRGPELNPDGMIELQAGNPLSIFDGKYFTRFPGANEEYNDYSTFYSALISPAQAANDPGWLYASFEIGGDPGWTDCTLRCTALAGAFAPWGVVTRFQDVSNFYVVVFTGFSRIELRRVVNGESTVLSWTRGQLWNGLENVVEVSAEGSTITARLNGRVILRGEDDALPSGRAGFVTPYRSGMILRDIQLYAGASLPPRPIPYHVTQKPYILWAVDDRAIILWEANRPAAAEVRYGPEGGPLNQRVSVPAAECLQRVELTNLASNTRYAYRVVAEGQVVGSGTISTDVGPNRAFTVGVIGDTQEFAPFARVNYNNLIPHNPNLVIHVGDICGWGDSAENWDHQFFGPGAALLANTPIYSCLGNHDSWPSWWYQHYLPYPGTLSASHGASYAFHYGNAAFLSMSWLGDTTPGSDHYKWIEETLASPMFQNATWKIFYFHHAYETVGGDVGGDRQRGDNLIPLFNKYGIDLVFNGHWHLYERSHEHNFVRVISGGGGKGGDGYAGNRPGTVRYGLIRQYGVIQFAGDRLQFTCYRFPDNTIYDRFVLTKDQPRTMAGKPRIVRQPRDGGLGEQTIRVTYPGSPVSRVRYRVGINETPDVPFWEPSDDLYDPNTATPLKVTFTKPGTYHVIVQALDEMLRPSGWASAQAVTIRE